MITDVCGWSVLEDSPDIFPGQVFRLKGKCRKIDNLPAKPNACKWKINTGYWLELGNIGCIRIIVVCLCFSSDLKKKIFCPTERIATELTVFRCKYIICIFSCYYYIFLPPILMPIWIVRTVSGGGYGECRYCSYKLFNSFAIEYRTHKVDVNFSSILFVFFCILWWLHLFHISALDGFVSMVRSNTI